MKKIYCANVEREINPKDCWPQKSSSYCKKCLSKKTLQEVQGEQAKRTIRVKAHPKFGKVDSYDLTLRGADPRLNIDTSNVRLILAPLREPKKSISKLPKQVPKDKAKDFYTGKPRRIRFDTDYWNRAWFHSGFEKMRERLGKANILILTISEVVKQPEMQWMRRRKRPKLTTLAAWRREILSLWQKDDHSLRIKTWYKTPR